MNAVRSALLLALLLLGGLARAGTACEARAASPVALAEAAATALQVQQALDEADAPLALVARVGTDLARHGLVYSHVGFALRDHPDGRWTVLHLLNRCGTDRSGIHAEGLFNFFADDLVNQDARIAWLAPALRDRLLQRLQHDVALALHEPRYNVISRPDSARFQNSTAWVLELLAAAQLPQARPTRSQAQALARAQGHAPDTIHIPYSQRVLGGLFGANVAFTDHPVATRLAGRYPVVTVRSILRWLHASGAIAAEREWREGLERTVPGPA